MICKIKNHGRVKYLILSPYCHDLLREMRDAYKCGIVILGGVKEKVV